MGKDFSTNTLQEGGTTPVGAATAANQTTQINVAADSLTQLNEIGALQLTQIGQLGNIGANQLTIINRTKGSNLTSINFTGSSLNNLVSNENAYFSGVAADYYIVFKSTFVDGLQPGGLLPAGYSSIITYSLV